MRASQAGRLRLFTALRQLRPSWAGALLLGVGLDDAGCELALAAQAAGAAALLLEGDAATMREAQRLGCCNFHVTTLEEALRVLKNEVRLGRAIAVAVSGNPVGWLAEMVERGVLPEAVAASRDLRSEELVSIEAFLGWGALPIAGLGLGPLSCSVDLAALLAAKTMDWEIVEETAASFVERRMRDAEMIASLHGETLLPELTAAWLRSAPSLFPRDLHRAVWRRLR